MTSDFSSKYITSGKYANTFQITQTDAKGNTTIQYMTRDEAFLAFCQRVANINDEMLKKTEEELQGLSDKATALTKFIQQMQEARANKGSSHDDENFKFTLEGTDGKTRNVEDWFKYFGLGDMQDVNPGDKDDEWKNEWDQNITKVQSELDLVNNKISQTMTDYDKYNNRMEKALDIAKSSLSQSAQGSQGVIGNM